MGEVAEDMRDGTCCSWCGVSFLDPEGDKLFAHGYPVICDSCNNEDAEIMALADDELVRRFHVQRQRPGIQTT